jgi:hypothetical protein
MERCRREIAVIEHQLRAGGTSNEIDGERLGARSMRQRLCRRLEELEKTSAAAAAAQRATDEAHDTVPGGSLPDDRHC